MPATFPPNYNVTKGRRFMDFIAGCVTRAKRQYTDPFIVVAGDFNQWKVGEVLEDYLDIKEQSVGPTRLGRQIDRVFTNFGSCTKDAGTVPPLKTDDQNAKKSDHSVAFIKAVLPRSIPVVWLEYSYRYYNEDSAKLFRGWLLSLIHI